ncbi:hypothetical protein D3C81_428280 [compost metagenome]
MKDAIRYEISGIKCDTEGCDFKDETVSLEDYSQWLNKPCPKCGGNLLTEEDYKNVNDLIALTSMLSGLFPQMQNDEEDVHMSVEMDGTGKVDFNIEE